MFIFIFSVFIWIITFFQDIKIWLLVFLIIVILSPRKLLLTLIAFILAVSSFYIKNYLYYKDFPVQQYFIWTWIILNIQDSWEYLLLDNFWNRFIYYSSQNYEIWDNIYTFSYFSDIKYSSKQFLEFDYPKWLVMKNIKWVLYESSIIRITDYKISFPYNIKRYIRQSVIDLYWNTKYSWLLLGMSIWDKSLIEERDYQKFIDSGLVHIIVVSWWNLVILTLFLNLILFFLPFYIRLVIISSIITIYLFICWMDSSILRAWIMAIIGILATFFGKSIDVKKTLSYSFVIMLLINPYYLFYDLWFLLSFVSIIWIVLIWDFNVNQTFISKTLKQYIFPILWATFWVFPILLLFIWSTNLASILANILILPILSFMMIYWLASLLLFHITWFQFILYIRKWLVDYVYWVWDLFSKYWIFVQTENIYFKLYIWIFFFILFLYMKKIFR